MRVSFIDPGRFRIELLLQAMTPVPDGVGGHAETWQTVASVMAAIEPVAARAGFGADQALETATHRVFLRHRADIASGMRLTRPGRAFAIRTVHDPDETERYLVALVEEVGR